MHSSEGISNVCTKTTVLKFQHINLLARSFHGWEKAFEAFEHVPALAWVMEVSGFQIVQLWIKWERVRGIKLDNHMHIRKLDLTKCSSSDFREEEKNWNCGGQIKKNKKMLSTCFSTVRSSSWSCSLRALSRFRVWCGLLVTRCPDMVLSSIERSLYSLSS